MLQMAVNSDQEPNGFGPGQAGQLCRELELAGAESLLTLDSDGAPSTGATITVDAASIESSSGVADRFRQQAFAVLARGLPLSVALLSPGAAADGHVGFAAACDQLYRARRAAGAASSDVTIVVDPLGISPGTAADIRRQSVGPGPLYLLADGLMQHRGAAATREDMWLRLRNPDMQGSLVAALAPAHPADELAPNVAKHIVYQDEGRGAFAPIQRVYGKIDAKAMIDLACKIPIKGANILDVVYDATALECWVAYAHKQTEAYKRPFVHVRLKDYLK